MPFDPTQNIINIDDYDIEEQVGGLGRYIAVNNVDEAEKIVLDFDKTEYLSSSGLRQIVAIHKKARELEAELSVINVHEEIMSIFSLTRIDKKSRSFPHRKFVGIVDKKCFV